MLNVLPELGAVPEGFLMEGPTSDLHSALSCGAHPLTHQPQPWSTTATAEKFPTPRGASAMFHMPQVLLG